MKSYRRFLTGASIATCAVAIAACGSSSKPSSGSSSQVASLVKYSECMRSHGASGFPDPSTTQGPNSMGIDGYNFNLPTSLNTQSPAYESAQTACQHVISGNGSGPPHPISLAKATQQAVAHAECMRKHGVPNFPDPKVSKDGNGISVSQGGPGMNPQSPAFQQAQKTCQSQ